MMTKMTATELSQKYTFVSLSVHFGRAGHCADEGKIRAVDMNGPLASVWVGSIRLSADTKVWVDEPESQAHVFLELL